MITKDIFNIQQDYLSKIPGLRQIEPSMALVQIGKATERVVSQYLELRKQTVDHRSELDIRIKQLQSLGVPESTVIMARSLAKYRNYGAHDQQTEAASAEVVDAALVTITGLASILAKDLGFSQVTASDSRPLMPTEVQTEVQASNVAAELATTTTSTSTFHPGLITSIAFASTAVLAWSVFFGGSFTFFSALRWVVSLSSGVLAYDCYRHKAFPYMGLFVVIALVFNPIVPLYLKDRALWIVIDGAVALATLLWPLFRWKRTKKIAP